jgi:hypothetical protein
MRENSIWAGMGFGAMMALCSPASAGVLTFTFAPNGTSPSLAGPGSAVTANGISVGSYLTAVVQPDFTFTVHQFLPVTAFTLNRAAVTAPGLGSSYGLYFEITGSGVQPPGSITYSTVNFALKADPGNLDGLPVATPSSTTFTNTGATGAADDITLASRPSPLPRERAVSSPRRCLTPRCYSTSRSQPTRILTLRCQGPTGRRLITSTAPSGPCSSFPSQVP